MEIRNDVTIVSRVDESPSFSFTVTTHEGIGESNSLSIHGFSMAAHIQCNIDQAEDLIEKLRTGIENIRIFNAIQKHKNSQEGK